ncbi:glucokinase [Dyadobacter jejuensis]|uniref:Glucokinase n=1 Tax=Dyadobacter jejuensis TaxID=1082580 RepID=A0A316AJE6_9BACT|nr:ROK family protein [Dyadobacter jejuensis]PWJ57741.1 glucokinase [Dyadobacter jejuensis]
MKIGVDIGGTNIRAGLVQNGVIMVQRQLLLEQKDSLDATLAQLIGLIRPLIQDGVDGIGIGVPSVVDVAQGIVYHVMNIPSWEEVALREILEEEFHIPVAINNDVNCFALGEHRYGQMQGFSSLIGLAIGTGLGSGIITNNRLYSGHNCGAGEIGMLPYHDSILEEYASNRFFEREMGMGAFLAHSRALEGDRQAIEAWKAFGGHLASAIKVLLYAFDPEAIVIGGSLAKAQALFQSSMLESLQSFAYPNTLERLHIKMSRNENIALLGAVALLDDISTTKVKSGIL